MPFVHGDMLLACPRFTSAYIYRRPIPSSFRQVSRLAKKTIRTDDSSTTSSSIDNSTILEAWIEPLPQVDGGTENGL
ncbi:uncharacterized protein LACBIDRAFT_309739 [Laccaria bicolor S238N-H82]|uniref:Predicted protein n=1 Tax=Laccaria bicolor (strain S238N-H82 / ATCC MYA-4686) TaxID=486041 RepID=B0DSZ2_LACBS|nr:uncharacterized protein LACBIDRAFT_309739 [Laccaria bicolor S238N-H82]EDR02404.1 predicted protein [Laccaria bicolor S238N-H82]|eukprot:XP_001887081.1 predicted protein [Laccaria bicolor S238N-H82]